MSRYFNGIKINILLQIFKISTYGIVLNACLSIFYYYFSHIFRGVGFYFLLFIPVIIVLLSFKNVVLEKNSKKQIMFFLLWAVIYIFNNQFLSNYRHSIKLIGMQFNVFTLQTVQVLCIILIYIFLTGSYELKKIQINISKIILCSFIIDSIVTLNALKIDSNISKIMATGNDLLNINNIMGVSGYSIIYGLVMILPIIYYSASKLRGEKRIFIISFTILMFFFIYKSAYTNALITLFLGICIYIFLNTSNITKILLIPGIIYFLLFFLNPKLFYDILIFLSHKIEVFQISERFIQLANFIYFNDSTGDTLSRLDLYSKSINAFFASPLVGIYAINTDYQLSGHSALLDILGGTGLLGFIPYILFIWYSYKNAIVNIYEKKCLNAIRTGYILFLIIASINTLSTSMSIMLIFLYFMKFYPVYIQQIIEKRTPNENIVAMQHDVATNSNEYINANSKWGRLVSRTIKYSNKGRKH